MYVFELLTLAVLFVAFHILCELSEMLVEWIRKRRRRD